MGSKGMLLVVSAGCGPAQCSVVNANTLMQKSQVAEFRCPEGISCLFTYKIGSSDTAACHVSLHVRCGGERGLSRCGHCAANGTSLTSEGQAPWNWL